MNNLFKIYRRALPLSLANMSLAALVFTDMAMLGHHDLSEMAEGSVMMQVYLVILVLGEGIVFGFSPIYGRNHREKGAGKPHIGALSVILFLVVFYALVGLTMLAQANWVLGSFLKNWSVSDSAHSYVILLGIALLPNLLFIVFWELLAFEEKEILVLYGALIQFGTNITANYVLIFGHFGAPAQGLTGAGWATVISSTLGAAVIGLSCSRHVDGFAQVGRHLFRDARKKMRVGFEILRTGLPAGITIMLTIGFLSLSLVLMAQFGTQAVAAHSAAMQISEVLVLFALGFGDFAAIRFASIGDLNQETARRELSQILHAALLLFVPIVGLALLARPVLALVFFDVGGPEFEAVTALLYAFTRWSLPSLIFSLVLMVLLGSLRGVGVTARSATVVLICYWFFAVPVQVFWLGQQDPMPVSIWHGLVLGFLLATLVLGLLWNRLILPKNPRLYES
ncbi:MATE family efflux transporter [Leisingera sp. MMG026]|uniref:MATE family efflux transporter n=1 Tax=Leisingera sp. MMG026 TaxID=2909982 RepID=UPI001EFF0A66|nr:MATE family efflux transporter [Leisingera sp. MMG026]MCF6433712.1 hypothetical protein [Leisingera sp. MMG026]